MILNCVAFHRDMTSAKGSQAAVAALQHSMEQHLHAVELRLEKIEQMLCAKQAKDITIPRGPALKSSKRIKQRTIDVCRRLSLDFGRSVMKEITLEDASSKSTLTPIKITLLTIPQHCKS